MTSPINKTPSSFTKILWEIHFDNTKGAPTIQNNLSQTPPLSLEIPAELLQGGNEEIILKLMHVFHAASSKIIEELMKQVTKLEDLTDETTTKNLEIAKMISWIKMIQQMLDKLKHDLN